ncbi:glycoside hydrolase family 3 N-terminal domain-containing protein [Altererythrobacter ishigakiensis]|uniref:Beta-D-glucoside glucohydrolase n=1 Tax=Altererythrobacter ishigakiensis TaxID=476157 RepID=A0A562UM05_9SPHN|nr:glycoside hydrolase family 3 N-terminal domain-containing protein [Altererythrobacter ishigakiensis]TWJ06653.1 beta-glucosidase [Altererythrobacter ishigakiensis]
MKIDRRTTLAGFAGLGFAAAGNFSSALYAREGDDFRDKSLSPARRAKALVALMTLDELGAQLNCPRAADVMADAKAFEADFPYFRHGIGGVYSASLEAGPADNARAVLALQREVVSRSRFGIPAFIFEECLAGLLADGATQYPQAMAMACAFNPELVTRVFAATAKEARSRGAQACFSPNIDICTDPRWGRSEETWGEDPYVVSVSARAIVAGLQGAPAEYLPPDRIATSVKHFAGYGQGIGGRNFAPSHIGPVELHNVVLPPFRAAIKDSGSVGLMASHGEIDGVPAHADKALLSDLLRDDWGFDGYVVSDWDDVRRIHSLHGVAKDEAEAAIMGLKAGVDLELANNGVYLMLPDLVRQGKLEESYVRRAAERVLAAKFKCGLFDQPWAEPAKAAALARSKEHRALARKMAEESAVLLKNDAGLLPLNKRETKRVLVVGPNAASVHLGGYSPKPFVGVSVLDGLRDYGRRAGFEVDYAPGCRITAGDEGQNEIETDAADESVQADPTLNRQLIAEAVAAAGDADVIVMCLGGNEATAREAYFAGDSRGDRDDLELLGEQNELAEALLALGKKTIAVLIHGRPLSPQFLAAECPAILDAFYPGEEGGLAIAGILFGDVNPSGKLPVTIARNVGQLPAFYYQKPTGKFRNYVFSDSTPLYPFGHGLSYTSFDTGVPVASANMIKRGDAISVSVAVRNTGTRRGKEVVQLYLRDEIASRTQPVKLLRGFEKVALDPGQERRVQFRLAPEDFGFRDANGDLVLEAGRFSVMVGTDSEKLKTTSIVMT